MIVEWQRDLGSPELVRRRVRGDARAAAADVRLDDDRELEIAGRVNSPCRIVDHAGMRVLDPEARQQPDLPAFDSSTR